jgi:probable addiction module antidote protein
MTITTTIWDPAERLHSPEAQAAYLAAAFDDGDPALITAALGDIARAKGVSEIARSAGVSRETMYKAFKPGGNPTLATVGQVLKAMG